MSRLRVAVVAVVAILLAAFIFGPMLFGGGEPSPGETPTTPTEPGGGTPTDPPTDGETPTPDDRDTPSSPIPPAATVSFSEQASGEIRVDLTNITPQAEYVIVLCADSQQENRLTSVGESHTCQNLQQGDRVQAFAWLGTTAEKLGEQYYGGEPPTPEPTPTPTPDPVFTPTPTPEPGPPVEATFVSEYLHDGDLLIELDTKENADYARVYCDADSTRSVRLNRIGDSTTCRNLVDGDEIRLTAVLNGEEGEIRTILYEEEFAP